MDYETYKAKLAYEEKSAFGKFWHGLRFSTRTGGIVGLVKFLFFSVQLRLIVRSMRKKGQKQIRLDKEL